MDFNEDPWILGVLKIGWLAEISASVPLRHIGGLKTPSAYPIEFQNSRFLEFGSLDLGIGPCSLQSWKPRGAGGILQDWKLDRLEA